MAAYNQIIPPNTSTASGNWVAAGYNSNGRLPATTASNYYTYNIIKGSSYASQNMAVLQTSYSPNALSLVSYTAGSTTVTLSAALSAVSIYMSVLLVMALPLLPLAKLR